MKRRRNLSSPGVKRKKLRIATWESLDSGGTIRLARGEVQRKKTPKEKEGEPHRVRKKSKKLAKRYLSWGAGSEEEEKPRLTTHLWG